MGDKALPKDTVATFCDTSMPHSYAGASSAGFRKQCQDPSSSELESIIYYYYYYYYYYCQNRLTVADGRDSSDDQSMRDAARHQQAMDTLSVFAASLADQMQIGTPPQTDAKQQEITEAFAEIAGSLSKSFLCMTPHEALVSCDRSSDTLGHSRHFEVLWALALSLTLLNVLLTLCQHILLVPFLAK